jgi:hypothetical protein
VAITHGRTYEAHYRFLGVPVRINGFVVTALVALGVVIAYDKVKNNGGIRKGV